MIYFIGNQIIDMLPDSHLAYESEYHGSINQTINFKTFIDWLSNSKIVQLDVETPPTNSIVENKLRTVQFGEYAPLKGRDKAQFVIEWEFLSWKEKVEIFKQLKRKDLIKVIQNAVFEYGVFLNYGVVIENVIDTMLQEKILYAGKSSILDEEGASFFSLEGIARRRLNIDLDKTYQILFGFENTLTIGHIIYAAQDVKDLDIINEQQQEVLAIEYPVPNPTFYNHIPTLENNAVLAFAEISWNGFKVDIEKWLKNAEIAQPILDKAKEKVDAYISSAGDEDLHKKAVELGYISAEDRVKINWNSPKQKEILIKLAFGDELPGVSKPVLKKYLKDNPEMASSGVGGIIKQLVEGDYIPLQQLLIEHCRKDLIDLDMLTPANTCTINWGSADQLLPLLQVIKPNTYSTAEQEMQKIKHPLAFAILEYRSSKMLTTTFGEKFLKKLDADGKARTRFNQILETGRVSSADPKYWGIAA